MGCFGKKCAKREKKARNVKINDITKNPKCTSATQFSRLRKEIIDKVEERNTKVENDNCDEACTCELGESIETGYITAPVEVPVTCTEGECTVSMTAGTVEINTIRTEGICRDKMGKGSFGAIPELDLEVSGKSGTITPELVDNIKEFMELQNR